MCTQHKSSANNLWGEFYLDDFSKRRDLLTFRVEAAAAILEQILFMSTVEVKKLSGHTPVQLWFLSVSKQNRPFVTSTKKVTAGLFVSKITRKVLSGFYEVFMKSWRWLKESIIWSSFQIRKGLWPFDFPKIIGQRGTLLCNLALVWSVCAQVPQVKVTGCRETSWLAKSLLSEHFSS